MSTTSSQDSKAEGKQPDAEEKTVDEAVSAEQGGAEQKANGSSPAAENPAEATVIDPPWTAAAEPSDSVFADRVPGAGFSPVETLDTAEPGAATMTAPVDKPVASAAGSSLSARFGRAVGSSPSIDGKSARRAHLQVSRFEPWSVMKFSFVMSLVCFVVLFVAVTVLYMILSGLGVFDSITETINETTRSSSDTTGTDAATWFSAGRILGYTALLGAVNVLLITALATVGSVIYNLAADFVGGVEVTLKEAE
ncbi:DUF3566 domain-containing protein [Actinocorallia longicatena]|uniref:DUF3566 domain-containing protein n=1 Tax=Actinocorallia longicatena TaxID=111803 RepID=A0ABP6QF86_9ACTN